MSYVKHVFRGDTNPEVTELDYKRSFREDKHVLPAISKHGVVDSRSSYPRFDVTMSDAPRMQVSDRLEDLLSNSRRQPLFCHTSVLSRLCHSVPMGTPYRVSLARRMIEHRHT